MTASQHAWMAAHRSRWVVDVATDPTGTVVPGPSPDWEAVFGRRAPLVVEIGSGHGTTLVAAARAHPGTDFLGFEVFDASVAATLGKLAAAELTNVRLVAADAVTGCTYLLPAHAVSEIWVFFPDPWPKKRHHKRRLVSGAFADLVARTLVPGGVVRLATDQEAYAERIAEVFGADARFELTGTTRFADRPLTKFEARGIAAGHLIHDFAYRVRP